jgi:hypothetical protein
MIPVEFPPGVTTLLSRSAKISNWRDANLVRWDAGVTLRPVGGWEKVLFTSPANFVFASRVRKIHKWLDHLNIIWTAYLCEQHCYVESGGQVQDITPAGGMTAISGKLAGYGELLYNANNYGVDTPGLVSTIPKFSPAWTLDNWGEDLLVMTSYDGRLLRWSPTSAPGTKLTVVTGAPITNRQFVVTPERHCMIFGMGGNLSDFGWCSQEDLSDWNFASITNTAGEYTADPYSPIVAAHLSSAGILVFTPAMTHLVDYVGLPYVYRIRPVGKVPIPISASSVASIPNGIIWVSVEGFWLWNGSSPNVIPCPVWDATQIRMDVIQTVAESAIVSILNRGEIWWFWVDNTLGSTANRYIALDFRSNVWMTGYLTRTCGVTYGNDRNPLMSDGVNIWKHETGFVYPNAQFMPYLESQTMNVAGGENFATISKILPDIRGDRTALAFSLIKQNDRTQYATQTQSVQRSINGHGWVDMRETARDLRLRIDMVKNLDWSTIGPIIFDVKPRGKK